jgi:hypothetical protein
MRHPSTTPGGLALPLPLVAHAAGNRSGGGADGTGTRTGPAWRWRTSRRRRPLTRRANIHNRPRTPTTSRLVEPDSKARNLAAKDR